MFNNNQRRHVILKTKNNCQKLNELKLGINSQLIFYLHYFFLPNSGVRTFFLNKKFAFLIPIRIAYSASGWGLFNVYTEIERNKSSIKTRK